MTRTPLPGEASTDATDPVTRPPSRRDWLRAAGLAATALATGAPAAAAAPPATAPAVRRARAATLDQDATVSAPRLDALAATFHAAFNERNALRPFDARRHAARHDVALHRLTTRTRVPETGETLKVSGLLALPVGVRGPVPVVSWQHGTILSFHQVPSNLTRLGDPAYTPTDAGDSLETLFNLQRLAGQGYAVIAADYIGKGPFREGRSEAYAVKDSTVRTCLDVLEAGLEAMPRLGVRPGPLFLNGWSQGGLNTQWLHQALRAQGRAVAGTAAQSPFNELSETFRFWTGVDRYPDPETTPYPEPPAWLSLCLIVLLGSYERAYGLDGLMRAAIRPEFQALATRYWQDYRPDFDPASPFPTGRTLLVDGFLDRHTADVNSAFLRRLATNRATYWSYDAPVRLYHGLADEALHPDLMKRVLSAGGHRVTGVPVARASHRATFLASLYGAGGELGGATDVPTWFDTLRKT